MNLHCKGSKFFCLILILSCLSTQYLYCLSKKDARLLSVGVGTAGAMIANNWPDDNYYNHYYRYGIDVKRLNSLVCGVAAGSLTYLTWKLSHWSVLQRLNKSKELMCSNQQTINDILNKRYSKYDLPLVKLAFDLHKAKESCKYAQEHVDTILKRSKAKQKNKTRALKYKKILDEQSLQIDYMLYKFTNNRSYLDQYSVYLQQQEFKAAQNAIEESMAHLNSTLNKLRSPD